MLRPKKLARDNTPLTSVAKFVSKELKKRVIFQILFYKSLQHAHSLSLKQ